MAEYGFSQRRSVIGYHMGYREGSVHVNIYIYIYFYLYTHTHTYIGLAVLTEAQH